MRLLLIHSDQISYEARKKTALAEEVATLSDALEEALTVFCAVESIDEEDISGVVEEAVAEIRETAEKLNVHAIMLYPYAHLSSDLASPTVAVEALKAMETALTRETDLEIKRAPFGWYKAFKLSCKGHPLSELSRSIRLGEGAAADAAAAAGGAGAGA
ncbi:MAG: threonyl-tRNA synthetase editing domain-containing protein, partial [Methanomicrobiaceae archaeon]|nr:threonyl-tRNA synthetase editing domain-containing protein [Methanomicrobiaceae archaeon]